MYLQKALLLLTNFYHAYTPYAIAIVVVLVVLAWVKPKTAAKLAGLVLIIVVLLYIGGLIKQGIDSSSEKKGEMVNKTEKQLN